MSCFYHKDKVYFEQIQKDLRKVKLLPKKYADRLAMAVCSCRRKRPSRANEMAESSTVKAAIFTETEQSKWNEFSETKRLLQNLANSISYSSASELRLLQIVFEALDDNFSLLAQEMKTGAQVTRRREGKVTPKVFNIILKRKQRSCSVNGEVILPIFGGSSKSLENEFGKGFCTIGKKYDCVVKLDGDKTREYMDKKQQKTVVKIWCKDSESFGIIKKQLHAVADRIQQLKTEHHRCVRATRHSRIDSDYKWDEAYNVSDVKDRKSEDFEKKSYKDRKHNAYRHLNKQDSSPLKGGRCYNCFKEYDFEKATSEDVCRYHRGYLESRGRKYYEWNCCYQATSDSTVSHYDHLTTGCRSGKHNWRPHKKASRADKWEKRYMERTMKRC